MWLQWLQTHQKTPSDTTLKRRFHIRDLGVVFVIDGNDLDFKFGDVQSEVEVEISVEARTLIDFWRGDLDVQQSKQMEAHQQTNASGNV